LAARRKSKGGPGWVTEFLAKFDAMDAALVAAGFPATSRWWRERLERFLRTGKKRWVLRVGRRGGKSSTLSRLLTAWILWGPWTIPPGDTAIVAIVSLDREEAAKRMVTIEAILKAIGVEHEKKAQAQEIHVPERSAAFAVKTCSLSGTVGFTSIAIFCDEQAKWSTKEDGANPAAAVMATLRPTMLTQPLAFEIDCSAPWGTDDYHAKLCAMGDTDAQNYDHAATWDANPSPEASEARTREMEPDEKEWLRAYAAIPSASLSGDWFGMALDRALSADRCAEEVLPWVRYTLALDVDLAREHLAWAVLSCRAHRGQARITRLHGSGIWKLDGKRPFEVAEQLRDGVCKRYNIGREGRPQAVIAQEGLSFAEQTRAAGLLLNVVPWTGGTKEKSETERYRAVWVAMREGAFLIPGDANLVSELRAVRSRRTPSGNEVIELPRERTDEGKPGPLCRVPAVILGASELLLRGPQPEPEAKTVLSLAEAERAAAIKEIVDKRRREWQKDPSGALRRALGM
jgi:hypothetical protein